MSTSQAPRASQGPPRRLSAEQLRALFEQIDGNKNGHLTHDSIMRHAFPPKSSKHENQQHLRRAYATELMTVADTLADGYLDFEEFERFVRRKEEELWELFCQLDRSGDGELVFDDLFIALGNSGNCTHLSDTLISTTTVFLQFNSLNQGVISFDEWLQFLMFHPREATMKNIYAYYMNMVHQSDSGDPILLPDGQKSSIVTFKYMIAGGFAGAVSRTVTAPLDRLKVLLQVNASHPGMSRWQESIQICKRILSENGLRAFWRGNGINILKIIPESAIRFYVFEWCKRLLQSRNYDKQHRTSNDPTIKVHQPEVSWQERLIAGGLAGFVSQFAIYPLETVKTRMMAELRLNSSTRLRAMDVARVMWTTDGPHAFFRGIGPSLFGCDKFDYLDSAELFHMQGTSTHQHRYPRGAIDVVIRTWQTESFKGFYKGLIPNLVKVVPAVSLSYICYEAAKKQLHLI